MLTGGDVRFGSEADICSAAEHVRFAPNSDSKSGHQRTRGHPLDGMPRRDKLMMIKAFAWIYNFASEWLTWLQALPPWQSVKHNFDDFIRWARKLNHDDRARGFR